MTYAKDIAKYAKGIRKDEADFRKREPAYGRVSIYKPLVSILVNSVGELNLNAADIQQAVRKGAQGIRRYIHDHKDYIKNQIINNVKVAVRQAYGKFDKLLDLIEKYEKIIEKQEKQIDKQEEKIEDQEKEIKNLEALIKKQSSIVKKAMSWKKKADTRDAIAAVGRNHTYNGPELTARDMAYLRKL